MRRPRLAPGFTALVDGDSLWLVAGEDVRYRLRAPDPARLRAIVLACDGTRSIDELEARDVLERLYDERVLVEGTAAQAHVPHTPRIRISGSGALAERLRAEMPEASEVDTSSEVEVFVQDSLDHRALLATNRDAIAKQRRWMWITSGPGGRAYVGPLFVPDAGPCAACLLVHFKRLSPVPELYDALLAHDGSVESTEFPAAALATVAALARWKLALANGSPAAPLYTLHVVEVADLTVSSHAPLVDVECSECR